MSKIIICDFDGTIVDFNFPSIGEPKEGVKEAFQKLKDMGCKIHILSSRTSTEVFKYPIDRQEQVRKMEQYLDEHEIPYDKVLNLDKPPAHVYIDDRAIGYRGDWNKVLEELENM